MMVTCERDELLEAPLEESTMETGGDNEGAKDGAKAVVETSNTELEKVCVSIFSAAVSLVEALVEVVSPLNDEPFKALALLDMPTRAFWALACRLPVKAPLVVASCIRLRNTDVGFATPIVCDELKVSE